MERVIRLSTLALFAIALLLAIGVFISPDEPSSAAVTPAAGAPFPPEESSQIEFPGLAVDPPVDPLADDSSMYPKRGRYVAAWMPSDWDTDNARASFEANLAYLDEISPVWYEMRSNGTLLRLSGSCDATLVGVAHAAGVLVLPSMTNGFSPSRTAYVLPYPERRSQLVERILDEVERCGYDGIDIDFEAVPVREREAFSAFIRELAAGLHEEGWLLTIAIHARTGEGGGAAGAMAQDWLAIGQVVDRFRIMTYDFHWSGGGPGPVAPVYWVRDVIEYAKTKVDSSKIVLGVPFYGYDWVGGQGVAVTWHDVQEIRTVYEPSEVNFREWDADGEVAESWFTYWARNGYHTVWFASRPSLEAKLDLVVEYDLAGIAIWRLGGEDPGYWDAIQEKLETDPYHVQHSIIHYLPDP